MPQRIPEEEIERIKREVDLVALVKARGVKLKRQGKNWMGLCPFHNDTKPSLSINPAKNVWNCLGACGGGGSTIDWVMKDQGVSFRHAAEILREKYPPGCDSSSVKEAKVSRLSSPLESEADDQTLLGQVIEYYHQRIALNPPALEYLKQRRIKIDKVLKKFKIGFADRSLGLRLPLKSRRRGKRIRESLQRLGVFRQSGHERFTGSIVIPIMSLDGVITEVYGRRITRNVTPEHLYLPGPHKGLFNPRALVNSEIILCESLIDALSFLSYGHENVTSSYGANGFTDEMLHAFLGHGTKKVYIAYDADNAGDQAAKKLARRLSDEKIACYRIEFPPGLDANAFVCEYSGEQLGDLLESPRPIGNGSAVLFPCLVAEKEAVKEKKVETSEQPVGPQPDVSSLAAEREAAKEKKVETSEQPVGPQPDISSLTAFPANQERVVLPPPETQVAKGKNVQRAAQGKLGQPAGSYMRRRGDVLECGRGDRVYRVQGLKKNLLSDTMRVTLRAMRAGGIHVDTLELYNARQRQAFVQAASAQLGVEQEVMRTDMTDLLLELERIQERHIEKAMAPKKPQVTMNDQQREQALSFLRAPNLVGNILDDFARCGLVGEQDNALIEYLAMTSRIMDDPLALIIQSLSAAGKTVLMNFALDFMPQEVVVKYTAMSGQSLFYMGESDLKHKILAISEEKGAEKAAYPLKIMQSEGVLCMASAGKDSKSGRFVTHEYRVEGPANILLATTALDIDEEFANRCMFISVDEDREQTRAIQEQQRREETIDGMLIKRERERIRKLHQNAQRLLRPLAVVNPYADQLSFLDTRVRYRRDQPKYLAMIRACALLHQYQRRRNRYTLPGGEVIEYIEVDLQDIALANRLFSHAMGNCLDELPPQTRKLLESLHRMVKKRCAAEHIDQHHCLFTRRQVREYTGWQNTQVKVHLDRLADLEYLLVRHGKNGQRYLYELVYQGQGKNGKRFNLGLLDVHALRKKSAQKR